MNVSSLSIHTENAQLNTQTTKPVLNMKQQHAQIRIQTELPMIIIDQTECFNTSGLKNNEALSLELSQRGYEQAMKYIAETAQDGDRFAQITKGGNPFVEIAMRKAYPEHEFGLVTMPTARPKIDVKGSLSISFTPEDLGMYNGVTFDIRLGTLDAVYVPGRVQIDYKV